MFTDQYYRIQKDITDLKKQFSDYDLIPNYFLKETNLELDSKGSDIIEFYKKKCVFITGGTGFLGKLLIEKLLRACTEIDTIYVLIRPKKDKSYETRLEQIFDDVVFSPLKKLHPDFRSKVIGINGDITFSGLGINPEDRKILEEKVNVIFHVAANIKFTEHIKLAYNSNVKGTQEIIALAQDCKKLESYMYVSTAYSNCIHKEVDEEFYEPPIKLNKLIELMDKHSDDELEKMTPKLLGRFPNTYTYTKNLAENVVKENVKFPSCVFRPSIVLPTYQEPLKGWTDNFYGPPGMILASGVGLLRTVQCDPDKRIDIIPADYVINCMIAIGYKTAQEKSHNKIYQYSGIENKVKIEEYMVGTSTLGEAIPTLKNLWPVSIHLTKSIYMHYIYVLFTHLLPAFLMDCTFVLRGKKTRMVQLQIKIHKFSDALSFFSNCEWNFKNNNTQELWNSLSKSDKNAFPFNMKELNWHIYYLGLLGGIRTYLLKDDFSSLDKARRMYKIKNYIHNTIKYTILFFCLMKIVGLFKTYIF